MVRGLGRVSVGFQCRGESEDEGEGWGEGEGEFWDEGEVEGGGAVEGEGVGKRELRVWHSGIWQRTCRQVLLFQLAELFISRMEVGPSVAAVGQLDRSELKPLSARREDPLRRAEHGEPLRVVPADTATGLDCLSRGLRELGTIMIVIVITIVIMMVMGMVTHS